MRFVKIRWALIGLLAVLIAGCGGGGGSDAGTTVAGGGAGTPVLGGGGGTNTGSNSTATVAVALSSTVITAASSATVTVTVRDANGNPVAGKVVDLKTVRDNLAALSLASVATDANGSATARLSAAAGGLSGADELVAVAKLGTTTVQGSASFSVSGSVPTLGLTVSATTLRTSTGAVTVRAVLKDAVGNPVANQPVGFSAVAGLVTLSSPSLLTDGFGTANVTVSAASAISKGAETITAAAKVAGISVQGAVSVQVLADSPSMTVTPSNSTLSATAPATLLILLRDTNNAAVSAGTIVSLTSSFGLTAFDSSTVATDATGVARVVVTPKTNTSNGADQIVASASVGGVTITGSVVLQVSSTTSATAPPVLQTGLSSTSISSASPATVTATLTDGRGLPVAGQVVTFSVVRGLAKTNVGTALTDSFGAAVVVLSPSSSTVAGADEVVASLNFGGSDLKSSKGFQVQATNVTLTDFKTAVPSLGAYGQTTMTVSIGGASPGSPVNVSVTSSCVSQGKATLSPSSFTATSGSVDLQFKDNGCGAIQTEDKLQATIVGTSSVVTLTQAIAVPTAASIAFVTATPEVIYIKASGFTETSTLIFEVRDGAGNILPNRSVKLSLLTRSGGVTMEGGTADITQVSDAAGRVSVRVNSGTQPSPIRVSAALTELPSIATVSSNLSVSVGLPSQLNFSLSQQTINIEGMNRDGVPNTYMIIASDRNGNPVPNGTSINFITESGQIEPIVRTTGSPVGASVSAVATAQFQSSNPRPADGRFTVTVYALGEESFIDQNGNNIYDLGEPFQDLGNLHKDRLFDGLYDASVDEYIPTDISNTAPCLSPALSAPAFDGRLGVTAVTTALLALDSSIPSIGASTCDGKWSGAGKVYVRRAIETVLSTSAPRALWNGTSGLESSCQKVALQIAPAPTSTKTFTQVLGDDTWYGSGGTSLFLNFTVADANTFPRDRNAYPLGVNDPLYLFGSLSDPVGRLNPMAAGTTVTASTPTTGLKVIVGGGTPVPSTSEATTASIGVTFDTVSAGVVFVTFTSPSGVATTYAVNVRQTNAGKVGSCP